MRQTQTRACLTIIIKTLQCICVAENLEESERAELYENIICSLGTIKVPSKIQDYLNFMVDVKNVQQLLIQACSNQNMAFSALKALFDSIYDPSKQNEPTMSIVLQVVDVEAIPTAAKFLIYSGHSEQSLQRTLMTLCDWLTRWIWTPNLGYLVLNFMQELETQCHYEILVEATVTYIQQLFKLLVLPEPRKTVGPLVLYMLSSMQHSPDVFHKIIPNTQEVLSLLYQENSELSISCLEEIINLFVALMNKFPGHKRLYKELIHILEPVTPALNFKQRSNYNCWTNSPMKHISLQEETRKVGLNNLGNTCYMNSILQALFMTKLFRNHVLLTLRESVPLFYELKILFALLQFSQRPSLSPVNIYNLVRPPSFQPGHQHDSSEFLGYLLDILHEQERSVFSPDRIGDAVPQGHSSESSQTVTTVQSIFGGRTLTISRCRRCKTGSEQEDDFRELQLSFPNNTANQSVQTLLNYYLQPETLFGENQYHCDTCRTLVDRVRVTRLIEYPPRLILTLKQFQFNQNLLRSTKLSQHIQLDALINLDDICYELYAVVVHVGSRIDSGHYYTFAREDDVWFKFNDSIVTRTTSDELGSIKLPETPYILFYNQKNSTHLDNIPISALSPLLVEIISKDNSKLSKERQNKSCELRENLHKQNDEPPPGCGGESYVKR